MVGGTKWPTGISPNGNGLRIRIWRGGKVVYSETIPGDPYSASDLAAAVKRREGLQARLKIGLPLHAEEETSAQLFADAAQDYLNVLDCDYSTALSYENTINKYWMPAFGSWLISDITTRHVKKELAAHKDISQKTKKNIMVPLRGIFAHAMDDGKIRHNPVAAVKLKRHQRPKVNRFRPEERDRILAKLSGQPLVYFTLFFATGMRPGEMLGAQWADWDGKQIYIHQQIVRRKIKPTTKTHLSRRVYVPEWARPALLGHTTRFQKEWIFINSRGDYFRDTDVFNEAWKEALDSAKVPYRIPYTCRHTRAAEMLSMGVEPGKAAKQLGHTLEMFYRTYAEWIEEYGDSTDLSKLEGQRSRSEIA